ncbi:hypothetical protein K1719_006739 [Acacia pycnantha]|nr:hypothetical protein K1719_006739 [Acacia pycnantha]
MAIVEGIFTNFHLASNIIVIYSQIISKKGEHKIYIWDRAGHLVKILEGPKEALIDLAWHPVNSSHYCICFSSWFSLYTENWSAFAPNFKELEEIEEYAKREDEFDLIPETEKVKSI